LFSQAKEGEKEANAAKDRLQQMVDQLKGAAAGKEEV
jgi:hypothetical protein